MKYRFRDNGSTISAFRNEFLVACPQCAKRAKVTLLVLGYGSIESRLICTNCGTSKITTEVKRHGQLWSTSDPVFGAPLWLQTPCCGETLWAYNEQHLAFLEAFVRADLREGPEAPRNAGMYLNRTLASRLPRWIKLARNRSDVLRGLSRLREKLTTER